MPRRTGRSRICRAAPMHICEKGKDEQRLVTAVHGAFSGNTIINIPEIR